MDIKELQILETLVIIVLYLTVSFVTKNNINNALKNTQLQRGRRKIIVKVVRLFTSMTALILLAGVWGLDQNELAVFASTVLTVMGVAFFAQWSLLSNITSSLILFFNHPLKIGDTIKVLDKDCPFEGEVTDLTYFFLHLRTTTGEIITIPNSVVLQKSISIVSRQE
jgi:small-conductance mechanosensitive channel